MRIAVLPMATRGGTTVVTLMTSMAMAYKQSKTVRMCFTEENPAIKRYMGLDTEKDATRSISQVSKLLQAHAIEVSELANYCIKVGPNLELMDSYNPALTVEEIQDLLSFVYQQSTTDFTICDLCYSWDDPLSEIMLKEADCVIYVAEPTWESLSRVQEYREKTGRRKKTARGRRAKGNDTDDIAELLVVNRYDNAIAPMKWCAKQAGMALRDTCKLHFNPYITKGCNIMDLHSVAMKSFERDPRVVELCQDLKEITQFLLSINNEKMRWED